MNQIEFAKAIGSTQANVSRWEAGGPRPRPDVFMRIAATAPDIDKFFFLDQAGLDASFFMGGMEDEVPSAIVRASAEMVERAFAGGDDGGTPPQKAKAATIAVPILSDPMAAGDPLSVSETDIECVLMLPRSWFGKSATVFGVPVRGHSMHPVLHDGDIALVDVARRNAQQLVGRMVAVRVGDGAAVKWLRRAGASYALVPENSSPEYETKVMEKGSDWAIVGEVIRWIGAPALGGKR